MSLSSFKKNRFSRQLKVKETVKDLFMVKYIAVMEARDGKTYLNVVLTDKTGDLEARKWHHAESVANNIKTGDYVFVDGKVNNYQNRLQVIINEITFVEPSEVDENDFILKAKGKPEEMYKELTDIVEKLDDVYIKELLKSILFDPDIERRLKKWQAGKTIHHAYQSGLLEHILSCTKLAQQLSKHYPVNKNFVIAGAILHDLCKIYELSDGPLVDYTDEGKLIGHVIKAAEILDHFCGKIQKFPYQTKMHLKHILISHHGELEFGSAQTPKTSEALLVHHIDLMDSKMASFETVKQNDSNAGVWSQYVKHLGSLVYKGELPHFEDKKSEEGPGLNQTMAEKLKDFKVQKD